MCKTLCEQLADLNGMLILFNIIIFSLRRSTQTMCLVIRAMPIKTHNEILLFI